MSRSAEPPLQSLRRGAPPAHADQPSVGRWLIDAGRSTLRVEVKLGLLMNISGSFADVRGSVDIAADPAASRVQVAVGTASLSSGSSCVDALMHGTGVVDSARNPTIEFVSTALRRGGTTSSWLLDGLLVTDSALLEVTLQMPDPVARSGCLTFRATGVLPSREAVRLLSQPGVERLLGSTMRLDLTVVATRA